MIAILIQFSFKPVLYLSQEFVTISNVSLYSQFILCSSRGHLSSVIRGAPFAAECEVPRFGELCSACDCSATAPADVKSSTTRWKREGYIIGSLPLRKMKNNPTSYEQQFEIRPLVCHYFLVKTNVTPITRAFLMFVFISVLINDSF